MKTRAAYLNRYAEDDTATADTYQDPGEPEKVYTGLLDARGEPIYRPRPTVKFGFQGSKA